MQIIIKRADGGVSIGPFADGVDPAKVIAKWQTANPTRTVVSWRISSGPVPQPADRTYRDAWTDDLPGNQIDIDMPKARIIHGEHITAAQVAEMTRLKRDEPRERLKGNATLADRYVTDLVALGALDLDVTATQIAAASNITALAAVWPALLPR